ncbi:hypothetical protein BaRGS_00009742 [Batillaria attramentaria]|uniref:ADP-ribosylation factor n=1 Tax=Batillaria attramentaria TaxID=370345 RepID=A0ABD0LIK1_9CAEN
MGCLLSRLLFNSLPSLCHILVAGLDSVGKKTVMCRLKPDILAPAENELLYYRWVTVDIIPRGNVLVECVGGDEKYRRPLYGLFKQSRNTCKKGILYVVDSSDRERIAECREELDSLLDGDQMRGVPVVVLANKQDLPGAMSVEELEEELQLSRMTDRLCGIYWTCAAKGKGVSGGLYELIRLVNQSQQR